MELQLTKYQEPIKVLNYEEVKVYVNDLIKPYTNYVVTEELIKPAKDDVATLNKIKKTLNDEKIRVKKELFDNFELQIKELIEIIDGGAKTIKTQLDSFEEQRVITKKNEIVEIFNNLENPYKIPLDKIYNKKWENKGSTLKSIEKEIEEIFDNINKDVEILKDYAEDEKEYNQILTYYLTDLDTNHAINSFKDYKRNLAEYLKNNNKAVEQAKEEPSPITPNDTETSVEHAKTSVKRYAVGLEFRGTIDQMVLLNNFLKEKGIETVTLYKKSIKEEK